MMVIAVSPGFAIWSWIAAVSGRPAPRRVPLLWVLGCIFLLALGSAMTVLLANAIVDRAMHDTYYVVAHFHYALSLCAVFAFFAGWYYLFPKVTGYMYSERLGKLHFWLTFVGVNMLLFPLHFVGLISMPRRFSDYPDSMAWSNWWASLGSYLAAAGTVLFVVAMLHACFVARGRHG